MLNTMDKKPLYLSKNFAELQKMTEISKLNVNSVKSACNLLEKLYEKYEQAYLDRDDELAYVFVMRFLDSFSNARKLFKSDVKYISAIISENKIASAFDRAESLKSTLKGRYDIEREKKEVNEKKEPEVVSKTTECDNKESKGVISYKYVYTQLKSGCNQILIVDTRPRAEFDQCHINGKSVINIPSEELLAGCSVVDVNALLKKKGNEEQNSIWKNRTSKTLVIVTDWDMTCPNGVNIVKDAIFKWDAERLIKEPVLLENGMKSFFLHYPTMFTNSQYKGPSELPGNETITPADIKYPNWNMMDMNKKKAEEEARAKLIIDKTANTKDTINGPNKVNIPERKVKDRSPERVVKDKGIETSVSELPSMVVDRTLKPDSLKDSQALDHATSRNMATNPRLASEVSSLKIDRTLKPEVIKESSKIETPVQFQDSNVSVMKPVPLRRLSSNSRTDQDRSDFTARGGAKSIPPPSEQEAVKLPPWITRELDPHTKEYYYHDRKNNQRYTTLPNELNQISINTVHKLDTRKETPKAYVDRVEVLKDHSMQTSKQLSTTIISSMKRSTSQPNLTEEALISSKTNTVGDNVDIGSSPSSRDVPRLDRQTKPSHTKTFHEFSASRLNSFNPTYRNVTPGLTGLRNMGNTCYMNSVIQALSNTNFLTNYILTDNYLHDININNPLGYKGDLVKEFALLAKALWKGQYKEISPADFKRMVDSKNEMFRGGEQHDSQEFLLFLLDGLHEDQNSGKRTVMTTTVADLPGDSDKVSDVDRAHVSWQAHLAVNDSVIVRMFQGQYRSKVTCDHCQASSVTFDAFMYLSLPLVTTHNRCSLDDCIQLFLAEEKMTGGSQWFCPKCKTNRNARKKIDIWKLPPYLLIHLKRFSCSGQYREKLNTFVDFPMDMLSLSDIISHTSQPHKHDAYHLYAVSNHHGNMESGHYTSYCKNFQENGWYNFDDDLVTRIKETDVKTPSAYILFYESYNLKKAIFKK